LNIYYSLYDKQTASQKEKVGHQVGYALLSYVLFREYGIEKLPVMEKGRYGKPYFPKYPQIHFNISHCDGMAACVLTEQEAGIDVEGRRKISQALIRKALTENERKELLTYWEEELEIGFLHYWTLKESFIKAIGKGLSYPLNKAEFSLRERKKTLVSVSSNQKEWRFFQTFIKDNYLLSVCFHKTEPIPELWHPQEMICEELMRNCSNFFNTENTD